MSRCRWLAASLLAALVTVSLSPAAGAAFAPQKKQNPKSHAHHLLKAEEDLVAAEAAIATQNLPGAHKHVAAAMHQVEEAIAHHHKHFMSQPTGSGLGGIANRAKHHNHHATLKQALAELVVAEKELKAGNGAKAAKDIEIAAKTIKNAVASHKKLIPT